MQKITTFLTFQDNAKEAIELYTSVFKNSKINSSMVMPGTNQLLYGSFTLDGQEFMAMDGGPHFKFEEGLSLFVSCETQEEVDYYWEKLGQGSDDEGRCGWLKDRFGVSWQIIPTALGQLMSDPDPDKAGRVREAMFKMKKLDIKGLQDAAEGN